MEFLHEESPAIVCFQEYYSSDKADYHFQNDDTLKSVLDAAYSHIENVVTMRETDHFGIATFSKYPIIRKQNIHFTKKGGSIVIISDIVIGKDTIRVFNTHLESVRFGWKDYKFIENINKDDVEQDEVAGSANILRKMVSEQKLSFFRASWIADYPDAENYLSVFYSKNFAPNGPNYMNYKSELADRFFEEASAQTNDSVRYSLYRSMDQQIVKDAPVVILYYDKVLRLYQNDISGLGSNAMNLLMLKNVDKQSGR